MSDQFRTGLSDVRVAINLLETCLANNGETWAEKDRTNCEIALTNLRFIVEEDENGRED